MTWTLWKQPRKTQELESDEISFADPARGVIVSSKPVSGVSDFYGGLITRESTAIAFKDFGFDLSEEDTVIGVELFLHATRNGRTQDKTITIFMNKPIGTNLADLTAEDKHTYSGGLETWKIASATMDYNSENFGVIIDLQPHTEFPCNELVYIRKVQVRLQLA